MTDAVGGMFRDLDRAYDVHSIWMVALPTHLRSPVVKHDPRFKALLTKMKIAEDKA
ncbi:MAG: hypothetical protein ABI120_02135 [Gemmatimonadaceae bacterium]